MNAPRRPPPTWYESQQQDAARARPIRHGDHVHRLAGQPVGDCGALWPAHISEADLDFATALFDVKDAK